MKLYIGTIYAQGGRLGVKGVTITSRESPFASSMALAEMTGSLKRIIEGQAGPVDDMIIVSVNEMG